MDAQGLPTGAFERRRAARRWHAERPDPVRARRSRVRPSPRPPHLRATSNDVIRREIARPRSARGDRSAPPGLHRRLPGRDRDGRRGLLPHGADRRVQPGRRPARRFTRGARRFATPWSSKQPMRSPTSARWITGRSASGLRTARRLPRTPGGSLEWRAGNLQPSSRAIPARTSPASPRSPPGSMTNRPAELSSPGSCTATTTSET